MQHGNLLAGDIRQAWDSFMSKSAAILVAVVMSKRYLEGIGLHLDESCGTKSDWSLKFGSIAVTTARSVDGHRVVHHMIT